MTFDARQLSPTRKLTRKMEAATSTHTGHTARPDGARSRQPIHTHRASSQAKPGYRTGIAVKMSPRLKNQSETENDRSASRSRLRSESGRLQSTRPIRNTAQNPSQTG